MKENVENESEYLTTAEAAQLIRKSPITLYRMRKNREIPFYRFRGQSILFRRSDLEAYLAKSLQEAAA